MITVGAWDALVGAKALQIAFIVAYLGIAVMVVRWSRGVLPARRRAGDRAAASSRLVSVPGWFARDKDGFTDPALASDVIGLLRALLVPLQLLLIAFAMRGFQQAWNVEVERPVEPPPLRAGEPAPA